MIIFICRLFMNHRTNIHVCSRIAIKDGDCLAKYMLCYVHLMPIFYEYISPSHFEAQRYELTQRNDLSLS